MVILLSVIFFFIILRFAVTLFNFVSNPKLRRVTKRYDDKVSILIPARNEAGRILNLLESIAEQEYSNYEVIILDDNSEDHTYELCNDFAASHEKFRVIKGQQLPKGWLGKNYACYQLARLATGKYLLFLDADEEIENGLINSSVHRMHVNNLALLSLFTDQVMVTFGEKVVVPLMHYILLNLLPIRLIYLSKNPAFSAASGQFMMFDAAEYHHRQWHEMVKDKVVEDIEIMRQVKTNRLKGEAILANGMISCRMYNSYNEAIEGFSKNFLAPFNYSIPGFMLYILLLIGGPLIVIATLNLQLIFFMCGIIVLGRTMISFLSGQSDRINTFLHPLQMLSLVVIAVSAIQKQLTKTNTWKGRRV
ncbi:glycosyltransferase family 2 protein [Mucilaginibacter sp. KACC 22063]|uniref:glycosyltransferase family 2 protein n=1 Tax=Mucilaginibacter sp. KACC 22063 TaxID=3025666 RepID=UPI0023659587|nr:glycosyltransferase family 2 protein [Mucilaginibacter sp. KACC 22063]WDF56312.1 glycosyltransferase family 2 protein [Mucilaginibacter sp. KACC 22063]